MPRDQRPINEQVIVITGASSGIGLTTAKTAVAQGARVVLAARSRQTLENIACAIESAGGTAVAVECDVSDRSQVESVAQRAIDEFGRIDTWINNAGVSIYGRLVDVSEEDHRRLFDINFWGIVNGSLAALPHLRRSQGVLINLGSEVSDAIIPLQGMYSASKHAVKGFNDALRVELDVEKIPVSVVLIQPTAVNTPFPENARNYMPQEPKLPTPQIEPQQVADAILQAAVKPQRYVKVGTMSKINTAVAKFAPALGDKVSGKQAQRQQRNMSPVDPEGSLYKASERGRVHGPG